jgi:hypothetical protein
MPISLDGTTAEGDIDFANQRAHIIGGMPGLSGFSGEMIVVSPYVYTRTYGQTKFTMAGSSTMSIDPTAASGPLFVVSSMVAVADDPGSSPVLVGDNESEPGGICYHIRVTVTQNALSSKLSSLQTVEALGGGQLDLWITRGDFQLERLEFSTTDPGAGAAAVRLVLSNWNQVPTITGPEADQFDIPGVDSPSAS